MKNTYLLLILLTSVSVFDSCNLKNGEKEIDPFYTSRSFGDIPTTPLLKPLKLSYEEIPRKWHLEIPYSFNHQMNIDSLTEIGVEKTFIYGKIFQKLDIDSNYKNSDYVFVSKFNIISKSVTYSKALSDEIRIFPIDTIHKVFIIPERWFVINVADSSIEAFFSKKDYNNYLNERKLSSKLYNIDSIHKQFIETGILPWFPDSIKTRLAK